MITPMKKTVWAIDPVHTTLRFDVRYLLLSTVSGWFRELEGIVSCTGDDFNNCNIHLIIYTDSLYTGNEERDQHLRSPDFFDTQLYPTIRLQSTTVTLQEKQLNIQAQLRVKDITLPVHLTAQYLGTSADPMGNTKAAFELEIIFNRKDFNISWNQHFDHHGLLLADDVKVHASIQLLQLS